MLPDPKRVVPLAVVVPHLKSGLAVISAGVKDMSHKWDSEKGITMHPDFAVHGHGHYKDFHRIYIHCSSVPRGLFYALCELFVKVL